MKTFLTEKQRRDIKVSLTEVRNDIFNIENAILPNDDNMLFELQEIQKRINNAVQFMNTARLYKTFEDAKGKTEFKQ